LPCTKSPICSRARWPAAGKTHCDTNTESVRIVRLVLTDVWLRGAQPQSMLTCVQTCTTSNDNTLPLLTSALKTCIMSPNCVSLLRSPKATSAVKILFSYNLSVRRPLFVDSTAGWFPTVSPLCNSRSSLLRQLLVPSYRHFEQEQGSSTHRSMPPSTATNTISISGDP
jgi:hypothetical protein